ncbi:ER lumen protein retaining receptor [Acorus gramineus]|uniref:ER lumen protein retaining receptor n=1 Tax=Acorus gramineus TaxID=55184 RepID=A0AAV9A6V2_ACOGR|nr:ER lumen protein retaining receptor [Acorus gramineus]
MGKRRGRTWGPLDRFFESFRRLPIKIRVGLGAVSAILLVTVLKYFDEDLDYFFIISESVHAVGILVLIYKLATQKTCSGLSLKTQEFTALFLAVRLNCNFYMDVDIHTILDSISLLSTLWVIYMIRYKLKDTYIEELDSLPRHFVVVPCVVLAVFVHPYIRNLHINRILWAFSVYMEAISVLPQLRYMQNAKSVEPVTSHYVFALGVARILGFGHWVLRVIETGGHMIWGTGFLWMPMMLLAELVQTFILFDFCYYYIKSTMAGQMLTIPSQVSIV